MGTVCRNAPKVNIAPDALRLGPDGIFHDPVEEELGEHDRAFLGSVVTKRFERVVARLLPAPNRAELEVFLSDVVGWVLDKPRFSLTGCARYSGEQCFGAGQVVGDKQVANHIASHGGDAQPNRAT